MLWSIVLPVVDFDDSSDHSIVLEEPLPADPDPTFPVCTDGQLIRPPEDCGGIPGFSVDLVNRSLASKRRRSTATKN
jgi:hypothetical protein